MAKNVVLSWGVYDFANTAFSALFVTFFFPKLIKEVLGGNEFQIGLTMGLSMFFVGILVPIIGTYSDLTGRRVSLIRNFTLACVACTVVVGSVSLYPALALGAIANFFYHACLVVYNSTLTQVSQKSNRGNISGIGVALGYLGTVGSLIMASAILWLFEPERAVQLMFPATALFFLLFSLPLFVRIKDRVQSGRIRFVKKTMQSFRDVVRTIKILNSFKGVIPFLLSAFSYSNGITAAVVFLYLYARDKLAISDQQFIGIYLILAVASAAGSYLGGRLSDKRSPRLTLMLSGALWIIALFILMFPSSIALFGVAGAIGGGAMGAIWAAIRPMMLRLVPLEKSGQFFGFAELADKFSGIIGPIVFGWLVVTAGYITALASMLVFFMLGIGLLFKVPEHGRLLKRR